jgi:hypothetical protein
MLRSEDWQGIIVFVALSVFIGSKAVSLSKTGSHISAWGGWTWIPIFVAQGLGVFLVCRTNGTSGSSSLYELGMVLHIACCAGLLTVVFLLHHTTQVEAAMISSFILLFSTVTTICMFFTQSIGGGFLYMLTGLLMLVICYKTTSIALSKGSNQASPPQGATNPEESS